MRYDVIQLVLLFERIQPMTTISSYILRVIAACLICGIVNSISMNGFLQKRVKVLCSIFLSIVILTPLLHLNFPDMDTITDDFRENALQAAEEGDRLRKESEREIIIRESEAYILNKANALGIQVSIEITLSADDPPLLDTITFTGDISTAEQIMLSLAAERDLGIPKERQKWIKASD